MFQLSFERRTKVLAFKKKNIDTNFFLLNIEMGWTEEQCFLLSNTSVLIVQFILMKIRGLDMHQTLVTVTWSISFITVFSDVFSVLSEYLGKTICDLWGDDSSIINHLCNVLKESRTGFCTIFGFSYLSSPLVTIRWSETMQPFVKKTLCLYQAKCKLVLCLNRPK